MRFFGRRDPLDDDLRSIESKIEKGRPLEIEQRELESLLSFYAEALKKSINIISAPYFNKSQDAAKQRVAAMLQSISQHSILVNMLLKSDNADISVLHVAASLADETLLQNIVNNSDKALLEPALNKQCPIIAATAGRKYTINITPLGMLSMQESGAAVRNMQLLLVQNDAKLVYYTPVRSQYLTDKACSIFESACVNGDVPLANAIMKSSYSADLGYMQHDNLLKMALDSNKEKIFTDLLSLYESDPRFGNNLTLAHVNSLLTHCMQSDDSMSKTTQIEALLQYIDTKKLGQVHSQQANVLAETLLGLAQKNVISEEKALATVLKFDYKTNAITSYGLSRWVYDSIDRGNYDQMRILLRHCELMQTVNSKKIHFELSMLDAAEAKRKLRKMEQDSELDLVPSLLKYDFIKADALQEFSVAELLAGDQLEALTSKLTHPEETLTKEAKQELFNGALEKGQVLFAEWLRTQPSFKDEIALDCDFADGTTTLYKIAIANNVFQSGLLQDIIQASNAEKEIECMRKTGRSHALSAYLRNNKEAAFTLYQHFDKYFDRQVEQPFDQLVDFLSHVVAVGDAEMFQNLLDAKILEVEQADVQARILRAALSELTLNNSVSGRAAILAKVGKIHNSTVIESYFGASSWTAEQRVALFQGLFASPDFNANGVVQVQDENKIAYSKSLLFCAAEYGDVELVKLLLDHPNIDVNIGLQKNVDTNDVTSAITQVAKLLLQEKKLDEDMMSPELMQKQQKYAAIIELLLLNPQTKLDADVIEGLPLTHFSFLQGILDKELWQSLEAKRPEVLSSLAKGVDKNGDDLLMLALRSGAFDLAQSLIGSDYFSKHTNGAGQTYLMLAVQSLSELQAENTALKNTIVNALLTHKQKDINQTDKLGNSALDYAAASGDTHLVDVLHKAGANITVNSLMATYATNNVTMLKVLQAKAPQVWERRNSYVNDAGLGICHIIARASHAEVDVLQEAIAGGASVNQLMPGKVSPLMLAVQSGNLDKVKILLSATTLDVNLQDREGNTALMYACKAGNEAIISALLEDHRVNVNILNRHKVSAFTLVTEENHNKHWKGNKDLILKFVNRGADLLQPEGGTEPLVLRIIKTVYGMACISYLSEIAVKYIPGAAVISRSLETLLYSYLVSNAVSKLAEEKTTSWLDADKFDLSDVCVIGNYHINMMGQVTHGSALIEEVTKNTHYANVAKAINNVDQMREYLPRCSLEEKMRIHQSLVQQHAQIIKDISLHRWSWTKNQLKELAENVLKVDLEVMTDIYNGKMNFADNFKELSQHLMSGEADEIASSVLDPQNKNLLHFIQAVDEGKLCVGAELTHKIKEITAATVFLEMKVKSGVTVAPQAAQLEAKLLISDLPQFIRKNTIQAAPEKHKQGAGLGVVDTVINTVAAPFGVDLDTAKQYIIKGVRDSTKIATSAAYSVYGADSKLASCYALYNIMNSVGTVVVGAAGAVSSYAIPAVRDAVHSVAMSYKASTHKEEVIEEKKTRRDLYFTELQSSKSDNKYAELLGVSRVSNDLAADLQNALSQSTGAATSRTALGARARIK